MNKFSIITFVIGAAVGSAVSWYLTKQKYESIIDEEINSVKEVFSTIKEQKIEKPVKTDEEEKKVTNPAIEKSDIMKYASKIRNEKYVDYTTKKEEKHSEDGPYVITPDEFGEYDDYTQITLIYYADNVLTDELDQLVENVEDTIGYDSLTHFGEYDDDSVYVRNDKRKIDYEILRSLRTYAEVIKENPYKAEM